MLRRCTLAAIVVSVATAAMAATPVAVPAAEVGINPIGQNAPQSHRRDGRARRHLGAHVPALGPGRARTARAAGTRRRSPASSSTRRSPSSAASRSSPSCIGAPQWANGSTDPYVPPRDPADFGRFLGSLAARERGKVAAWEIWNEPDEQEFWHGQVGAAAVRAAADRRPPGDPARPIPRRSCSPAPRPATTTRSSKASTRAGAGGSFDGVAVHTDTACLVTPPDTYYREADGRVGRFSFLGFREVHDVLERNGNGDRPIIMTELGWSATKTRCSRGASAGKKAAGVTRGPAGRLPQARLPLPQLLPLRPRRALVQPDRHERGRHRAHALRPAARRRLAAPVVRRARGGRARQPRHRQLR